MFSQNEFTWSPKMKREKVVQSRKRGTGLLRFGCKIAACRARLGEKRRYREGQAKRARPARGGGPANRARSALRPSSPSRSLRLSFPTLSATSTRHCSAALPMGGAAVLSAAGSVRRAGKQIGGAALKSRGTATNVASLVRLRRGALTNYSEFRSMNSKALDWQRCWSKFP